MIEMALSHPNKTLGVLLFIVGVIDYIAGSTPTNKDDRYVGFTQRLLHQLKRLLKRNK